MPGVMRQEYESLMFRQDMTGSLFFRDAHRARDVKHLYPDKHILHRFYPDGNIHEMGDWRQWCDMAIFHVDHKAVVIVIGNELATDELTIDWLINAARYMHSKGQAFGVGAWGMGGPDDTDPDTWQRVMSLIDVLLETGGWWITHEYYAHYNPRYRGSLSQWWLTDDEAWQAYTEGEITDYVSYDYFERWGNRPDDMSTYSNWLLGRYARHAYLYMMSRLGSIPDKIVPGVHFPRVAITEHGPDEIWLSIFKGPWQSSMDGGPYLEPREYVMHLEQAQMDLYDVLDRENNPYGKYCDLVQVVTPFCLGDTGGWETFDITRKPETLDYLTEYADWRGQQTVNEPPEEPMSLPDATTECTLTVLAEPRLNVRSEPSTASRQTVTGALEPGVHPGFCGETTDADGWHWLRYRNDAVDGWLALSSADGTPVLATVTTGPEEPPPPPPGEEDLRKLIDQLNAALEEKTRQLATANAANTQLQDDLETAERERQAAEAALTPYRDTVVVISALLHDLWNGDLDPLPDEKRHAMLHRVAALYGYELVEMGEGVRFS